MALEVTKNEQGSRYELHVDGDLVGIADYAVDRGTSAVEIPHTEIDPRRRGQGLAAVLVRETLDDLRATGHTVVPTCWYVARYIDQHPEYHDLLAT